MEQFLILPLREVYYVKDIKAEKFGEKNYFVPAKKRQHPDILKINVCPDDKIDMWQTRESEEVVFCTYISIEGRFGLVFQWIGFCKQIKVQGGVVL